MANFYWALVDGVTALRLMTLTPGAREGIVTNASLEQVRAPISTSALGKWQRYEAQLSPLVAALGGQAWIDDWAQKDAA